MESSGKVGKVNISASTYDYIKDDPDFSFSKRGRINAKNKGMLEMYFVFLKDQSPKA
jgi:class 3 adenylate cyclase